MKGIFSNTPGWIIMVCVTALVLTFGTMTFWLSYKGVDDTQFRGFVIVVGTMFNTLLSGGAFLASAAAQKQTNGLLTDTVKDAVHTGFEESGKGDGP